MEQQLLVFDYNTLDTAICEFVQKITKETHILVNQTDAHIVQIGKNLQAVKDMLSHGQFLPWLQTEFGWTERTAQNFMNYARLLGKNERLSFLPREVGYVLGQKSMPDTVLEMVGTGHIPATIPAIREAKQALISSASLSEGADGEVQSAPQEVTYVPDEYPSSFADAPLLDELHDDWRDAEDGGECGLCLYGTADSTPEAYVPFIATQVPPALGQPSLQPLHEEHREEHRGVFPAPARVDEPEHQVLLGEEGYSRQEQEDASLPAGTAVRTSNLRDTHVMRVMGSSESPEWYTPSAVIAYVLKLFGEIDLDPCSNSHEAPTVPATTIYTKDDDGLAHQWRGKLYMNPPYGSEIGKWIGKLVESYEHGEVEESVSLLPGRIDTVWFQPLYAYFMCNIRGRLQFANALSSAPFPCVIVYMGKRTDAFIEVFKPLGPIMRRVA